MTSRPDHVLWAVCAVVKLAILAAAGSQYGYLADELYFLDAADHLALGYVDFPPAIAWVMAGLTGLFGSDLIVLRTFACALGIVVTVLAVEVARLLGGGRTAQWLTAIVVLFAPAFLSIQSILTMNVLDQLWWVLGFVLLIRYLQDRRPRYMLLLGAVFGLSLLTKLAMPAWFLGLGIAALIHARWTLARPEVWGAMVILVGVASPFLYWQVTHDWLFVEFIRAYNDEAAEAMVIDQPLFGLITTMNPPFLLIWLPGLIYGLITADRTLKVVGTAAVVCLTVFLAAGVKFYFATPLFILFTAAGALLWERWLTARTRARALFVSGMAISGLFSIPIAAPVLPGAALQRVADFIRDAELQAADPGAVVATPGKPGYRPASMGRYFPHFAEMHGWPELVTAVAAEYEAFPPEERAGIGLLAAYFGQAGALNQLDRAERLPVAHSGHMNYTLWAEGQPFDDIIAVGFDPALLQRLYRDVTVLQTFRCERCMARENGLIIARCRDRSVDSDEIRSQIKRFYFF
ncbi:MAG: ArnT family glycosyltransferase [Pseudomonadales bacterium]